MSFLAVTVAALVSAALSVLFSKWLRLPWWANLLAAVISWFGLGLELAVWDLPEGDLPWVAGGLAILPTVAGGLYAVITRGMLGLPDGPMPRKH